MRTLFKTHYSFDIDHLVHPGERARVLFVIALALALPLVVSDYGLGEFSMLISYAVAGIGLMVLTGFSGQVSFGHGAFMAIGAYGHIYFLERGLPFSVSLLLGGGVIAALAGFVVGRAASKMHGFYLAIATLAFAILIETVLGAAVPLTGGHVGKSVPEITILGYAVGEGVQGYYLYLVILLLTVLGVANLMRSAHGRAMMAIRDSETSAQSLGVNISQTKVRAFVVSAFITGVGGALLAHKFYYITPEAFGLNESLKLMLMIVIGGLGTISGAIIGAILVSFLPNVIEWIEHLIPGGGVVGLEPLFFGLIIVAVILFEPDGLYGRWRKIRLFLETFPLYKKATFTRQKRYLKTGRFR